mmetsp:Transcript_8025/g.17126  ORF Transcript_8025/g.17126 Transcript_8025/m.17126 type:complete len:80 (+) Transcript_8025:1317-1556(+)
MNDVVVSEVVVVGNYLIVRFRLEGEDDVVADVGGAAESAYQGYGRCSSDGGGQRGDLRVVRYFYHSQQMVLEQTEIPHH